MIKFFRHIRLNLLETGKTTKYLKYAIGEIILVMVGILLALQVNNWNQNRINGQRERLLLSELNEEFLNNQSQLEAVLNNHKRAMKSTQYVISLFPIDPKTIDLKVLKENSNDWGLRFTFNPSQGVIRSLINSSSFDIISNPELRQLLVSWEDVLADYQEEENVAAQLMKEIYIPKFLGHLPWKDFEDNRFDRDYLSSIEFENIFYARENNIKDILENPFGELNKIQETISKIIELSKTENDN